MIFNACLTIILAVIVVGCLLGRMVKVLNLKRLRR